MNPCASGSPSILFLNHNLSGRGTYFRNYHLARALARLGWRATLWTQSASRSFISKKREEGDFTLIETPWIGVEYMAANGCCFWDISWRLFQADQARFDFIVASDHLPNVSLPFLSLQKSNPQAITVADWADLFSEGGCHARWNQLGLNAIADLEWRVEIGLKRQADYCTATSHALLQRLVRSGISADRCLYLPSGCDATVKIPSRQEARNRLGIESNAFVIGRTGSSGRIPHWEMDQIVLLAQRIRRVAGTEPKILLVGEHQPEWYPEFQCNRIHLIITGRKSSAEVPGYLVAADLCVLVEENTPFNRHRGPIRLADYLLAGVPVLVNSVGDMTPFLLERKVAVCCDDLESDNHLLDQVIRDSGVRFEMGRQARALAQGDLSWAKIGNDLSQFLLRTDIHSNR